MAQPFTTCWAIALKAEAKPLIGRLGMKKHDAFSKFGYEVFYCDDESQFLVISGVGKIRSASAVAWLAGKLDSKPLLWVNLGIAGNRDAALGSVFRAGRVQDQNTDRSWYPQAVRKKERAQGIETGQILTVEQPCFDYPAKSWLVEMEAAGFAATAMRFSGLEWLRCYKVISDNLQSDPKAITAALVESLCDQALDSVLEEISHWRHLAEQHFSRTTPIDCTRIVNEYRFSVTEQHQLQRLLKRAIVLNQLSMDNYQQWATDHSARTGKQLLKSLRELLTDTERTKD